MPHIIHYLMLWTFYRMYIFFLPWLLLLYFYTWARFYFWGEQKPRTCQKVPQKLAGKIWGQLLIYILQAKWKQTKTTLSLSVWIKSYCQFSNTGLLNFFVLVHPSNAVLSTRSVYNEWQSNLCYGIWCSWKAIKNKGPKWRLVNLAKLKSRKAMQKNYARKEWVLLTTSKSFVGPCS